MRDDEAQFIEAINVVDTDMIYSYESGTFEEIYLLEKINSPHEVVCINTEPYDIFFTENMLVHDSHPLNETSYTGGPVVDPIE